MKNAKILRILGFVILVISFISTLIREHITSQPFDVATVLGVFTALATTPLFWIGVGLEEFGRIKNKKIQSK